MSVQLEQHNQQAYNQAERIYQEENRVAIVHPTGSRKRDIALKLIGDNEGKKVIYLAPSTAILHQLKYDMIENGVKFNDGKNKLVERYTYEKLLKILKNDELNIEADIIVLDEIHQCVDIECWLAVKELLAQNPNAKVLGLFPIQIKNFDEAIRDMAKELFGSNIASEMTFAEAIEQGVLSPDRYVTGIYDSSEIISEYEEKVENYSDGEEKEVARERLKELRTALDASVEQLPELLEGYMTNKSGKYIVYCKNIEDMQKKIANVQELFGRVNSEIELYSVSSKEYDSSGNVVDVSDTQNVRQVRRFKKSSDNGKLKLLFSVDMLKEGWNYSDIDGVVMMRPTNSVTLFAQELGIALSAGRNRRPVVIDLVSNADSIRVIEDFYKQFENTNGNAAKSVLSKAAVLENTRNISEIMKRLDSLIKRKSNLSVEEKLDLMLEYLKSIEGADESFTSDTVYKGYPIGSMRANLRDSYWNQTLKIDGEILEKLKENGIIVEKPETIRTSMQEKYEFLASAKREKEEEFVSKVLISATKRVEAREKAKKSQKLLQEYEKNMLDSNHLILPGKESE